MDITQHTGGNLRSDQDTKTLSPNSLSRSSSSPNCQTLSSATTRNPSINSRFTDRSILTTECGAGILESEQKEYEILVLDERDDVDTWKGWKRQAFRLLPLILILNTLIYFCYLGLRMYCIVLAQRQNKRNSVYEGAWVFVAIEISVAIPTLMQNMWSALSFKQRKRQKLRLAGRNAPIVDVLITCCGEEDELVMDTARAALHQDYPSDRFRVIILDDAKSEGLKKAATLLSETYPNLFYRARTKVKGVPHHFKAGNLNYGLEQIDLLPGGRGELVAALDADMIPESYWLRAVIPHIVKDPRMALACPPQLFYNTPPADPLAQSLDFFVHVAEPIKDALGVAWCTGSGYVARRTALSDVGNFPIGSIAEDVMTSSLMLGKGWKTAYVHEPLQFGTVPGDFGSHLKQRTRWALGTIETSFKLNFCLWGPMVRRMTLAQRLCGCLYACLSLYTIFLTVSLFALPVILASGHPLIAYPDPSKLQILIWASFAVTISNRLTEFVLFLPAGYHTGQRGSRFQLWMAPYIALCLVRSFVLPSWLGGKAQAFKPTGSIDSELNERDETARPPLFRRMKVIIFNYMALFHFCFVWFLLTAVATVTYRGFYVVWDSIDIVIYQLTHAFWPPLMFLFVCQTLWVPLAYAIDPPHVPHREELLERDPKTNVAHPNAASKKIAFGHQLVMFEIELTISTIYTIAVFIASFFIIRLKIENDSKYTLL